MPSVPAIHRLPATAASVRYAPWTELDEPSALAVLGACLHSQVGQAFQPDTSQAESLTYPFLDRLLGPRERQQYSCLHCPRRQREWLAGRTLAKQLITDERHLSIAPEQIEILSSAESRRPHVWIHGQVDLCSLSIAHSSRGVVVALAHRTNTQVGIDLTERTPLSASFVQLWFTADERAWLAVTPEPFAPNQIWAAKEALYKACNRGEGFDPRQISVLPGTCHYRSVPFAGSLETFECDDQIAALAQRDRPAGCTLGHAEALPRETTPNLPLQNNDMLVPTHQPCN